MQSKQTLMLTIRTQSITHHTTNANNHSVHQNHVMTSFCACLVNSIWCFQIGNRHDGKGTMVIGQQKVISIIITTTESSMHLILRHHSELYNGMGWPPDGSSSAVPAGFRRSCSIFAALWTLSTKSGTPVHIILLTVNDYFGLKIPRKKYHKIDFCQITEHAAQRDYQST